MFSKQGKVLVADVELMRAAGIPLMKPGFANIVRHIEKVELVSASSLFKQGAHPHSADWRVSRKI